MSKVSKTHSTSTSKKQKSSKKQRSSKDNIRVMCRFRTLSRRELDASAADQSVIYKVVGTATVEITLTSSRKPECSSHTFDFDSVLGRDASQNDVYAQCSALVCDVFQGYNATIFAYGQTGSGKTFSMIGESTVGGVLHPDAGVVPRAVRDIWDRILLLPSSLQFAVTISYCEIYNEQIHDLINPKKGARLKIRGSGDGIFVQNLTEVYLATSEQFFEVFEAANDNRVVGATDMNAGSSRSHAVLTLKLEITDTSNGRVKTSKLMLVDLAGSEKVKKTGATGDRLTEAKSINRSLSTLGGVLSSLTATDKSTHVPYRDSILTWLLSDSIGGNCRTVLLICCAPSALNCDETMSTLRFGARAKKVRNKPKKNEATSITEYRAAMRTAKRTMANLYLICARSLEELREHYAAAMCGTVQMADATIVGEATSVISAIESKALSNLESLQRDDKNFRRLMARRSAAAELRDDEKNGEEKEDLKKKKTSDEYGDSRKAHSAVTSDRIVTAQSRDFLDSDSLKRRVTADASLKFSPLPISAMSAMATESGSAFKGHVFGMDTTPQTEAPQSLDELVGASVAKPKCDADTGTGKLCASSGRIHEEADAMRSEKLPLIQLDFTDHSFSGAELPSDLSFQAHFPVGLSVCGQDSEVLRVANDHTYRHELHNEVRTMTRASSSLSADVTLASLCSKLNTAYAAVDTLQISSVRANAEAVHLLVSQRQEYLSEVLQMKRKQTDYDSALLQMSDEISSTHESMERLKQERDSYERFYADLSLRFELATHRLKSKDSELAKSADLVRRMLLPKCETESLSTSGGGITETQIYCLKQAYVSQTKESLQLSKKVEQLKVDNDNLKKQLSAKCLLLDTRTQMKQSTEDSQKRSVQLVEVKAKDSRKSKSAKTTHKSKSAKTTRRRSLLPADDHKSGHSVTETLAPALADERHKGSALFSDRSSRPPPTKDARAVRRSQTIKSKMCVKVRGGDGGALLSSKLRSDVTATRRHRSSSGHDVFSCDKLLSANECTTTTDRFTPVCSFGKAFGSTVTSKGLDVITEHDSDDLDSACVSSLTAPKLRDD